MADRTEKPPLTERIRLASKREWPLERALAYFDLPEAFVMGADLLRQRKPDRFREFGFGSAIRIDRQRVASAA
jgi:hypothetical protein